MPRLQGLHDQGVLRELLPAHVATSPSISPTNAIEVHQSQRRAVDASPCRYRRGDDDRRPPARVQALRRGRRFCFTYGDGVADVDIGALVDFHRESGTLATVTAVQPPGRFGALEIEGDRVTRLRREAAGRRRLDQRRLLRPHARGRSTTWRATRPSGSASRSRGLARDGPADGLPAPGFWQPMDTLRESASCRSSGPPVKAPWAAAWEVDHHNSGRTWRGSTRSSWINTASSELKAHGRRSAYFTVAMEMARHEPQRAVLGSCSRGRRSARSGARARSDPAAVVGRRSWSASTPWWPPGDRYLYALATRLPVGMYAKTDGDQGVLRARRAGDSGNPPPVLWRGQWSYAGPGQTARSRPEAIIRRPRRPHAGVDPRDRRRIRATAYSPSGCSLRRATRSSTSSRR